MCLSEHNDVLTTFLFFTFHLLKIGPPFSVNPRLHYEAGSTRQFVKQDSTSAHQALIKPAQVYRLQWHDLSCIHQAHIEHTSNCLMSACGSSLMNACIIKRVSRWLDCKHSSNWLEERSTTLDEISRRLNGCIIANIHEVGSVAWRALDHSSAR